MKGFNAITRFMLFAAGVCKNTINQTTASEVNKYRILGSTVLIPATLAFVAGFNAMYLISGSILISIIFAVLWMIIIFILDRAVVSTTLPGRFSFGSLGRIFLAIIIAFTISEPVILRLFNDSIEERRVTRIAEKQRKASEEYDNQIVLLKNESKDERNNVLRLQSAYIGEVDGTDGSRIRNFGPISQIKKAAYDDAKEAYNQNETARNERIRALEENRNNRREMAASKDAKGFLGNMVILGELGKEVSVVLWATWFLRLLFMAIELIPLLIKLGMPKNDLYHDIQQMNNNECIERHRTLSNERQGLKTFEEAVMIEENLMKLKSKSIKNKINSKFEDFEYLIDRGILSANEKYLNVTTNITEKVDNDEFKEKALAKVKETYDDYMETIGGPAA